MTAVGPIEKVYEPSHIRRWRLSTTPTWYVVGPDNARWRFMRKRDAQNFVACGGTCEAHENSGWTCRACNGVRLESVANLADAVRVVETHHPLPRCTHGHPLRDGGGERLEPSCGCR